jgi:glycosyltransferase 2 family protein
MSKKWLAIALKATVSGGLIWYLVSGIDLASLKSHIARVDVSLLVLATSVLSLQIFIGGARWGSVLKGLQAPLPFSMTARLFFIGMFFNQALPGGNGGDAARMYLSRKHGASLRNAINGVIVERVATVLALVILVDVTQPLFLAHLQPEIAKMSVIGVVGITLLAIVGIGLVAYLDRLPETLRRWRVVRGLGNLGIDTRQILFSPARALMPLVWSLIGHLNVSLSCYVLAMAVGLDVTLLDCVVLIPPILLILTIPISIGGWGVREGAMVTAFALVGVPGEGALVLSLLFGVIGLVVSLPGGIVWLMMRGKNDEAMIPGDELSTLQSEQENA